jgi:3-hydroxyisobutyrate dehydrogenase-like beta-hydroxyacid dehydrogenase
MRRRQQHDLTGLGNPKNQQAALANGHGALQPAGMSKTIGVIGLGIIGGTWAGHYHAAGVLRGTWNRTAQAAAPQWQTSPEAVTEAADVVQIVVADPPAVESILTRILPVLDKSKVVVQSSTIDPASSVKFAALVAARGARYLEAPFTGSKPAAEQRQTVFYLGGDAALITELEPLFSLISATRLHIGSGEQAATLKLAMNLNISAQMEALCEALTLVRRAGVSDDVFFGALGKNVSYSGVTKLKEPKLRADDYAPQFSVKHMAKDMRLASKINGCEDFPVLDAVRHRLAEAERAGYADEDFSALMKLLN